MCTQTFYVQNVTFSKWKLYLSLKESTFEMWKDMEWIDLHLEDVQCSIYVLNRETL